jgi:hypothetical protein
MKIALSLCPERMVLYLCCINEFQVLDLFFSPFYAFIFYVFSRMSGAIGSVVFISARLAFDFQRF